MTSMVSFMRSSRAVAAIDAMFPCGWRRLANLVLEAAMERIYHGLLWAQIPRGLFLVRGENVVLLGEVVSFPLPVLILTL